MKITLNNINTINFLATKNMKQEDAKKLLYGLLIDVDEINKLLIDKDEQYRQIYIDWQDVHNEYSAERTDPCPDFYGMFTIRFEKNNYETIGECMFIEELDNALLILANFIEFKLS